MRSVVMFSLFILTAPAFAETMNGYRVSYECIKYEKIKEETIKVLFNNPTAAKLYADDHKARFYQIGGNIWAVEYQVEEVVGYLFDGLQCNSLQG
ncbi:MAG: hypothetical protein KGK03_04170 [Candidatus Omnitrophica bacterium]|nr:hypothetical protein [Candidatus Omnitrophota bacterium]MDE2222249.1 hypothetical protein [Candidatus Omnitrophota bacterium]